MDLDDICPAASEKQLSEAFQKKTCASGCQLVFHACLVVGFRPIFERIWHFTAVPVSNENPNFSFRRAQKGNHPLTLRQEAAGRDPHSAECVMAELHPVWDFGCVSFLVARQEKPDSHYLPERL